MGPESWREAAINLANDFQKIGETLTPNGTLQQTANAMISTGQDMIKFGEEIQKYAEYIEGLVPKTVRDYISGMGENWKNKNDS